MKHTPLIRYQAAVRALDCARQECAHWDQEGDWMVEGSECCYAVDDAKRELRKARKAVSQP